MQIKVSKIEASPEEMAELAGSLLTEITSLRDEVSRLMEENLRLRVSIIKGEQPRLSRKLLDTIKDDECAANLMDMSDEDFVAMSKRYDENSKVLEEVMKK